ncbi:MAG TPA: hypothetical protein VMY69_04195 [Phycisphaerae bacterium]|nr:hypothetical protein [Phycisphaerae bacterium]
MKCSIGLAAVAIVLACGPFATAADKPEGGEIHFRTVRLIPFDNNQCSVTRVLKGAMLSRRCESMVLAGAHAFASESVAPIH